MAWPDGISDPHCGSNNLQGYARGDGWDHTHPPVLPWVWEAYIWEVRKGPLMEARSSFNPQARSGLSFQPQLLGSHG